MLLTLNVGAGDNALREQRLTETPNQYAARMKWFGEAQFGMFIHWGVYSVPAGEFDGKTGYGEWILETVNREDEKAGRSSRLPISKYEKYAGGFNPVKFDACEWARLAKEAGMKYLVITSKHHDGFGLWDSQLTDWDIARTPFKRDPLKELAEACKAEGIAFCLYYSIMDWHHPDYENLRAWNDLAPASKPDMSRYMTYMKGQLREILTNYGPLGLLWFDGEWEGAWNTERGIEIYNYIRALQPQLIVNNRVGRGRDGMAGMTKGAGVGDYGTPEQEIPPVGFGPGVFWESCMTMNNHWGYNKHDNRWKSTAQLVRNLIDCASKGGNYLLNVGPTAEGLIPMPSIERLREMGQWTKANGEALYGTEAGPFRKLPWGRATQKSDGKTTTLYLHVFDWPTDGQLVVPGLKNKPASAQLLVSEENLTAKETDAGIVITLPASAPDKISTTIVLKISGQPQVVETRIAPGADGNLLLDASDTEVFGKSIRLETIEGRANVGHWGDPSDWIQWQICVKQAGEYEVSVETSGEAESQFTVEVGDAKLAASNSNTQSYHKFAAKSIGTIKLVPGNHALAVRPVSEASFNENLGQSKKWQAMNLRQVRLTPKK